MENESAMIPSVDRLDSRFNMLLPTTPFNLSLLRPIGLVQSPPSEFYQRNSIETWIKSGKWSFSDFLFLLLGSLSKCSFNGFVRLT